MGVLFVPSAKHERKRVLLERIYEIVYREAGGPNEASEGSFGDFFMIRHRQGCQGTFFC